MIRVDWEIVGGKRALTVVRGKVIALGKMKRRVAEQLNPTIEK